MAVGPCGKQADSRAVPKFEGRRPPLLYCLAASRYNALTLCG
jgi:hypothetical protein